MYIFTYTYFSSSKGYQPKRQTVSKRWKQSRSAKSSKVAGTFTPYTCTHTHTQICILIGVHTHIYIHTHTSTVQKDTSHSRRCSLTKSDIHTSGCKWLLLAFAWDFRQALDARLLTPTRSWCHAFSILSELPAGSCKLLSWLSLVLSKTLSVLRS